MMFLQLSWKKKVSVDRILETNDSLAFCLIDLLDIPVSVFGFTKKMMSLKFNKQVELTGNSLGFFIRFKAHLFDKSIILSGF